MNPDNLFWCMTDHDGFGSIVQGEPKTGWGSKRGGFMTEEECRRECAILPDPCRDCGGLVGTNYVKERKDRLTTLNICFHCDHWRGLYLKRDADNVARINGNHYMFYPSGPDKRWDGFGGQKWSIQFNDGRVVETTNLWSQGKIGPVWQDRLPDNAVFLKNAIISSYEKLPLKPVC